MARPRCLFLASPAPRESPCPEEKGLCLEADLWLGHALE